MRQRKRAKKKTAFVPRSLFRALAGGTVIPVCVLGGAVSGGGMTSCGSMGSQAFGEGGFDNDYDTGVDEGADVRQKPRKDATVRDGSKHADSPDASCDFATFVIDLIKNDTTSSAVPSKDLGESCTDNEQQSDFASLFP